MKRSQAENILLRANTALNAALAAANDDDWVNFERYLTKYGKLVDEVKGQFELSAPVVEVEIPSGATFH